MPRASALRLALTGSARRAATWEALLLETAGVVAAHLAGGAHGAVADVQALVRGWVSGRRRRARRRAALVHAIERAVARLHARPVRVAAAGARRRLARAAAKGRKLAHRACVAAADLRAVPSDVPAVVRAADTRLQVAEATRSAPPSGATEGGARVERGGAQGGAVQLSANEGSAEQLAALLDWRARAGVARQARAKRHGGAVSWRRPGPWLA